MMTVVAYSHRACSHLIGVVFSYRDHVIFCEIVFKGQPKCVSESLFS